MIRSIMAKLKIERTVQELAGVLPPWGTHTRTTRACDPFTGAHVLKMKILRQIFRIIESRSYTKHLSASKHIMSTSMSSEEETQGFVDIVQLKSRIVTCMKSRNLDIITIPVQNDVYFYLTSPSNNPFLVSFLLLFLLYAVHRLHLVACCMHVL